MMKGGRAHASRWDKIATPEMVQALEFARSYEGKFAFMLSMRARASDATWRPTFKQATAIQNCMRNDVKD